MRAILSTLCCCIFLHGCSRSHSDPPNQQRIVEEVRSEVAKILKKDTSEIDVSKPLVLLGADDLDVVEIVMVLEDAFKIEIPDSDLAQSPGEASKTLTVEKLAEIVSRQLKARPNSR